MNWRNQREKYGKIRRGQLWKKIHNGVIIQIEGKAHGERWKVKYKGRSSMTHVIEQRMIYHYFDLIH